MGVWTPLKLWLTENPKSWKSRKGKIKRWLENFFIRRAWARECYWKERLESLTGSTHSFNLDFIHMWVDLGTLFKSVKRLRPPLVQPWEKLLAKWRWFLLKSSVIGGNVRCARRSQLGLRTKWADPGLQLYLSGGHRIASGFHSTGHRCLGRRVLCCAEPCSQPCMALFCGDSDLMDLRTDPSVFLKLSLCVSSGQSGLGITHCSR